MNTYFKNAVDWFKTTKAPELKDKVEPAFQNYADGKELSEYEKKLFCFLLFSYAMNNGPASFLEVEAVVKELNVLEEFSFYAKDWIDYSKKDKKDA